MYFRHVFKLTVVIVGHFGLAVGLAAAAGHGLRHHQQLGFKWIRRHS